ncbi:MAG TPA: Gfo/Idh/MocA family oxidoreductase [Candidatus Hydrogenedentes bacterium]|nr:Gfo/Idh/MocA family oxidoreductase [Candidatus Hydrogenedentota bacterium]HPG66151.1 Gfo/Idh/MocA family oxidoreductase [Candidatus Hydrogenedentota bacterium]
MSGARRTRVGIIGSGFEADIHAESLRMVRDDAEIVAVASPTPGKAKAFAAKHGIPRAFQDYRDLLREGDIDMVAIAAPNYLHAQMTIDAALAGKHVLCEKPLCMTLEEADEMVDVCQQQGVLLMYAEELLFTPKYVKAKEMADQGAFGKVYMVKQCEKHFGPHAEWFWDVSRSGGGVFMDMGCHGVLFCYWFLGRPAVKSVYCQMATHVHGDKTEGEDDSICILEFEGGVVGVVEDSWARRGGMHDRAEIYGEGGLTYADLHMGNALPTYSEYGYGYAVEKAPGTQGWSYPVYEELWNYGFPQEMRHFTRCARGLETPIVTGLDGRLVQEILYAGYQSAGTGAKVPLPFRPTDVARPIDLWLKHRR